MGGMRRANSREAELATDNKYVPTLVIASAVMIGVRLAREDMGRPSPRITAAISGSVSTARALLRGCVEAVSDGLRRIAWEMRWDRR